MYHECVSESLCTLSDCTSLKNTCRHPTLPLPLLPLRDGFGAIVGDGYAFAQSFYVVFVEGCNPVLPKVVEMNNRTKFTICATTYPPKVR